MHVTFLLYAGIEPIDLAAIGVVSMAKRVIPQLSYETVAATTEPVRFSNGLMVLPDRTFDAVRAVDVLVVPGGLGWRGASRDPGVLSFIRRVAPSATVCSVCTGAMILAEAGVLDGLAATTKVEVVSPERSPLAELRETHPEIRAERALVIDAGSVIQRRRRHAVPRRHVLPAREALRRGRGRRSRTHHGVRRRPRGQSPTVRACLTPRLQLKRLPLTA